jgi:HEAT repeat protein
MDIQPLIENLSHPDESERLFAADDLGMANAPEAVDPLIAQLAIEPSRAVREMIVLALRKTESDAVMDHAVRLLGSNDPYIRNEMAALLQAKGEAALPWLTKAQQHVDADVRKLALEAACQIPGEHTAALLTAALADADANVVISAVEIIGTTASASFREPLEELAREESSPMLLLAVIDALGNIGDERSLLILLEKFGSKGGVSFPLIHAVGNLGDSRHLEFLEAHSNTPHLRQEVIDALLNIQRRGKLPELPASWLARIEAWVRDGSPQELRQDCVALLQELKTQPAALSLATQLAVRHSP